MTRPLRALVACETSGAVRQALRARGWDATSCDLLPADDGSNHHITDDVRNHLHRDYDLLIVAHPPCTRLCNSGVRWLHQPPPGRTLPEMWAELDAGCDLFTACWNAPVPHIAVENPVMHKHARARLPADLPKPQIVQPWWFGVPRFKATGFFLRGLPPLVPTNALERPRKGTAAHKAWSDIHRASPGPDRWKFRSATPPGVAQALADQWGGFVETQNEETA
jgi:hypothetical protein